MKLSVKLDYDTYKEVSQDLLSPIIAEGLDLDTLKRLYMSKLVYLNNLRKQCFRDINKSSSVFSAEDLTLITQAISQTNDHLRALVLNTLSESLNRLSQKKIS
jgi:hypothetical protein